MARQVDEPAGGSFRCITLVEQGDDACISLLSAGAGPCNQLQAHGVNPTWASARYVAVSLTARSPGIAVTGL